MKYLFLHNMRSREENISILIRNELCDIDKNAQVYVTFWDEPGNNIYDIVSFNPDVLFTFPFTIPDLIEEVSAIKRMCQCKVCIYTTEGYMSPQRILDTAIGYYNYPPNLIDKYIFFGEDYKEIYLKENKLLGRVSDSSTASVAGYPMYEFDKLLSMDKYHDIYDSFIKYKEKYSRTILVLSGFAEADKTKKDIIICNDSYNASSDSDEGINDVLNLVNETKEYRQQYYDMLTDVAQRMPDTLFILKLHPVEIGHYVSGTGFDFSYFNKYTNIHIIFENIPLCVYLSRSDALIHYGSTACVEAYILHKPSIFIPGLIDDIFPSDYSVQPLDSVSMCNILNNPMHVIDSPNRDEFCLKYFNYNRYVEYHPSKTIAEELFNLSTINADLYDTYVKHGYYDKLYNAYYLMALKQYVLLNFKLANKYMLCRKLIRTIKQF